MTTSQSAQRRTINRSTTNRSTALRRTVAGLAAATTFAFGGLGTISTADAQAAGVKTTSYVVQSSSGVTAVDQPSSPRRGRS